MTHSKGTTPKSLTEKQLKLLLDEALKDEFVDNPETYHALYGHPERGIETDDVLYGLEQSWTFERPPTFNEYFWQWKYYIATETVDGELITIIIAVDTIRKEFEVITRWREH